MSHSVQPRAGTEHGSDDHRAANGRVVRLVSGSRASDVDSAGIDHEMAGDDTTGHGRTGRGVDPASYRQVFRRHAAGVTVVTLDGPSGPIGFTATSVASLSLDPPLISLSVASSSSSWPALLVADTVVVHLLCDGQDDTARRFASKGIDRFAPPTRWTRLPTGEPLLAETAAWVRARLEHRIATGDHRLLVARVLQAYSGDDAAPLIYHDGRYGTITVSGSQ
ncbi:flavin reductase family protein [Frankia sp. Cppng1_Ct_nod]|uniref:flavin reductase family protein n=1 Tax=Frankia sp. Cppng1_Ct_nod TaxID=2897162 RepID=UPI0010417788